MKTTHIYIALALIILAGLILIRTNSNNSKTEKVTQYDAFAQCITDAGATFYGAYWCPHCQAQKKLFDNSSKLPYVECSTPNGQAQTQICIDKKITGYPTWEFVDGSRGDGQQTFEQLAEKTNCPLPQAS